MWRIFAAFGVFSTLFPLRGHIKETHVVSLFSLAGTPLDSILVIVANVLLRGGVLLWACRSQPKPQAEQEGKHRPALNRCFGEYARRERMSHKCTQQVLG